MHSDNDGDKVGISKRKKETNIAKTAENNAQISSGGTQTQSSVKQNPAEFCRSNLSRQEVSSLSCVTL